jgi:hypothetical protein
MLLNNPYQVVSMVIDVLTFVVLTLTLAVVFWYTVVTHRMQRAVVAQSRELVRQRQLSNMPALVADIKRLNGADYLQLTNIGKGVAINIAIDDVEIRYPTLQPGHIEFNKVLMLPVGGTASVESDFFITSGDAADRNSLTFLGPHAHFDADVNIRFQDIEGTNYLQTVRMGKNGYRHGFVKPTDAP